MKELAGVRILEKTKQNKTGVSFIRAKTNTWTMLFILTKIPTQPE